MPVPAPVTVAQAIPAASIAALVSRCELRRARDRRAPLVRRAQVLRGPVIRVDTAKRNPRRARDHLRDRHGRRARRGAAAMRADVDLDEDVDRHTGGPRRRADVPDGSGIVGEHADLRPRRHRCEARELPLADDLVGDEHVANAGGDEGLGLADFLAADADRAALDLGMRDVRALVRLRVRAQRNAGAAHGVRHQVEVALERVQVDDERRGVDVVDRVAGTGGKALHQAHRNLPIARPASRDPARRALVRPGPKPLHFGVAASAAASCP